MMKTEFAGLLARYGQAVTLWPEGVGQGIETRAFFQPILERGGRGTQQMPTPLGETRKDRFLYLGDPAGSLRDMGDGFVLCHGARYDVQMAQPVYVGEALSHWWAILTPRDRET